jgi:glycosyltransferase involved in cell wall biosynthesis
MKFSIITVCLNSEKTIAYTLNSVLNQTYKNIEHVIVDGGSNDKTLKIINNYPFKNKKVFKISTKGIYGAINKGIEKATGQYICVLHSDDIFHNNEVIKKVSKIIKENKKYKIFFGDVVYFRKEISKISRFYPGSKFEVIQMKNGIIPPHTASFINKEIYNRFGDYKTNYVIASDFEFYLRILFIHKLRFFKCNEIFTRMKAGGLSGKNMFSYFISTREIIRSFKENKIYFSYLRIISRLPLKIVQFFNFNEKKLNHSYNFNYSEFLKKIERPQLSIIQDIRKLFLYKTFILSALNLAFLGHYTNRNIKIKKNLICWPDGYFAKFVDSSLPKIPGREVLKNLNIPKNIKEIIVYGNLSIRSKNYLQLNFKKKIIHRELEYGSVSKMLKKVDLKIRENQLTFITLPTPKQEIFAQYLAKKNNNYKIICIGGSIAIASGEERPVPKIISYLEFIWRLRYETYRRINRLINTFTYFIYGKFYLRKLKFKILERL